MTLATELDTSLEVLPTELDDIHGKSFSGIQPHICFYNVTMIDNDNKIVICITEGRPHDIFMRSHDTYNGDLARQ